MKPTEDRGAWSPYLAGGLTGVVAVLSVLLAGKYFGASTTFVRSTGMLEEVVAPERVSGMDYFLKEVPMVDWQWMFVLGIFFGALVASRASGSFLWKALPDMWEQRFGSSRAKRGIVAFLGGTVAMFGARLADGCPSGHGLSGLMQLAVSGFIALACFFLGGLLIARILYGGGQRP